MFVLKGQSIIYLQSIDTWTETFFPSLSLNSKWVGLRRYGLTWPHFKLREGHELNLLNSNPLLSWNKTEQSLLIKIEKVQQACLNVRTAKPHCRPSTVPRSKVSIYGDAERFTCDAIRAEYASSDPGITASDSSRPSQRLASVRTLHQCFWKLDNN